MSDDQLLALLAPIVDRVRQDVSAVKERGPDGKWKVWRSDDALTRARLVGHLSGPKIRGAYLVKPGESVVRAAVLDLDDHGGGLEWEELAGVAARLVKAANKVGLRGNAWSSSSGHGIHLWFLWDEEQDARSVRVTLEGLLRACMLESGAGGVSVGEVEIFPKQDSVEVGGYGNQVWLPLGGKSLPLEPDFVDGTLRPMGKGRLAGYAWQMSEPVAVVERVEPRVVACAVHSGENLDGVNGPKLDEVRAMVDSVRDYTYDNWLLIGFTLHDVTGGGDDGLALWEEWSQRGGGFEDGACARKWATMGKGGEGKSVAGLGTLRMKALASGWVPDVSGDFEDLSVVVGDGVGRDPVAQDQPRFERDKSGRPLATTDNILMALARVDLVGFHVALDDFTDDIMIRRNAGAPWVPFKDDNYTDLKSAMENKGKGFHPISRVELRECLGHTASRCKFDSAQEWLAGLQWDGVRRIDDFLVNYLGAADNAYSRAVSRYMWSALAGRVMRPGCQIDMVPILVGGQGAGKTQSIKALVGGGSRFCELAFDMKDDDVARKIRGVLVAEIAELRGLGTRDEESIKAFVTRQTEKWVPKFKEFSDTFERRVVMFGTTNDTEFLGDVTGNRRWLPFNVGVRAGRSDADVKPQAIARDKDLLWAEARELFGVDGVCWQEAEELARFEHSAFMATHPWEDRIRMWIAESADIICDVNFIPVDKIFTHALGFSSGRLTGADGRTLSKIMTRLGYVPARCDKGGRGYRRIGS